MAAIEVKIAIEGQNPARLTQLGEPNPCQSKAPANGCLSLKGTLNCASNKGDKNFLGQQQVGERRLINADVPKAKAPPLQKCGGKMWWEEE